MTTITINNRKYKVLEAKSALEYPAFQIDYPGILEYFILEGARGGLHIAVRKENGIFLS